MQYSTILFDLDDTLWDTSNNSKESLSEVFNLFSFNKHYNSFDEFYTIYFKYNMSLWEKYEKHTITKEELKKDRFYTPFKHIEDITIEKAALINQEFMSRTASKGGVVEGAKEILEALRPHYKIGILSNGFKEVQHKKIKNAGLNEYFDKVILSDDIGLNKPRRELFEYALNKMGVTAGRTVMIGDSWSSDIEGAYKSNIDQIWYNPDNETPKGFKPTYTIKKLDELKGILLPDK